MLKDTIRLRGYIKATVYRADGTSFVHLDERNTINQEILNALATDMLASGSNTFGFVGNDYHASPVAALGASDNSEDGIAIKSANGDTPGDTWYGLTIATSGTGDTRKITGTFTGFAVTIEGTTKVQIGRDWNNSSKDYDVIWATPTSWSSLTLTALDTLIIEWTFEFK